MLHEVASREPCCEKKGCHDPDSFGNSTPDAPDFNHPFHMGDLVNMTVVNKLHVVTTRVSLSAGRLSVFDENGSAFYSHQ